MPFVPLYVSKPGGSSESAELDLRRAFQPELAGDSAPVSGALDFWIPFQ